MLGFKLFKKQCGPLTN